MEKAIESLIIAGIIIGTTLLVLHDSVYTGFKRSVSKQIKTLRLEPESNL